MGRTRLAKASIAHLKEQIKEAGKRKEHLQSYLKKLHERYANKDISYATYVETLHKKHDKRNIHEHISHCDYHIQECEKLIRHHKKHIIKSHTLNILIFSAILITVAFLFSQLTNTSLTGFLISETGEGLVNITEPINETNITIIEINETNITSPEINIIPINESEINITVNETSEIPINVTPQENATTNITTKEYIETTTQLPAKLGESVKWIKNIQLKKPGKTKIDLPKESTNILIKEKGVPEKKLSPSLKELPSQIEISIDAEAIEYEITYGTPSPSVTEELTTRGKIIKISSPDTIHYENILAFTSLPESLNVKSPSRIRIHWIEQDTFISPTSIQDRDSNGIYDYIEWLVPSLSNQTFEIIIITKAEHLDSNRNFISDIYDQVKALDGIWSENIPNQDYVRVAFEVNLTSSNDITIYSRKTSGSPKIEIYEKNSNVKIAEFTNIQDNQYNKVFLTSLQGSQDAFDLKIVGGSVEFDHIIDPQSTYDYNSGQGSLHFVYESPNSGGTFPPLWTDGWTGTEILSYTNVQSDNTNYITQVGGSNTEPYFRFNFTIAENPADINWIYVTINGFSTYDGGEDADCFVANFNTATWDKISDMPTSDGGMTFNITSSITNYMDGDQLVYLCFGKNLDSVDEISIDYIQVTVDYTVVTDNPPQWQNPSIDDSTPNPGQTLSHNINWTDDAALSSSILEINSSGTNCDTLANVTSTTFSGTVNWSNLTWAIPQACEGKVISWKQFANDSTNQWNVTSSQTYLVNNVNPTASFGTNPVDTYNSTLSSVTFELSCSDNFNASSLQLWGNWTGTWHANQTNSSPINATTWPVSVNIPDGKNHVWAAYCSDTPGNQDWSDTNRTLTVDTQGPSISNTNSNETEITQNKYFCLNASVTDFLSSIDIVYAEVYNTTSWLNYTMADTGSTSCDGSSSDGIYGVAIQGTAIGLWNYSKTFANDSLGNSNVYDFSDLTINVTTAPNAAPTIDTVDSIPSTNPTDDTTTAITFNFTATDTNGASDINLSSAQAYFQRAGESTRSNTSCMNLSAGDGNNINFTCTINMWYYDQNGAWTINVSVKDNSNVYVENSSTTFTYNVLTAMKMSPVSLTWDQVLVGQTNIGSNNDPIQVNNTGNDDSLNINVTSYNLRGEQVTTDFILAGNISVENASQGCTGTAMSNATSLNITSAILFRGNHSLNYNNATSGQEQIYFCLTSVPSGISQQPYSSSFYGSWEVRVLLALMIPRLRRKKKPVKDDKLLEALGLILDELKEEYSLNKKEITEIMISKIKEKYKISKKEIIEAIQLSKEITIPSSIFTKELGALESLVKYMKENLNLSYKEISILLSRNERTIWTAYKKAIKKQKEPIKIQRTDIQMPIEIFKNSKLTILELTIVYLKEKGFKLIDISKIVNRDQRNVSSTCLRAVKKLNKA